MKLPREALHSGRPLTVNSTAIVVAAGGQVRVLGSFVLSPEEGALKSPQPYELVFILEGEKWDTSIGQDFAPASSAFLRQGIYSQQDESGGWNAVVQPQLQARHVTRRDDRTVTALRTRLADDDDTSRADCDGSAVLWALGSPSEQADW